VRRYRGRILVVGVALLGRGDPEVEDVVQETFIAALGALEGFEFRSSLYTWLNHICVRLCYRRIRQRSRTALGSEQDLAETLGAVASGDDPGLRRLDETRQQWLRKAVEAMDKGCRTIIQWRDFEGLSYGDLSRRLKAPIGTVMSRLSRCREKLRRRAKAWMDEVGRG
jgi:RNA polymerase sigma-70 factor (ECF subfamily)